MTTPRYAFVRFDTSRKGHPIELKRFDTYEDMTAYLETNYLRSDARKTWSKAGRIEICVDGTVTQVAYNY